MSTVARPGGRPCSRVKSATSSAVAARRRAATAFPSMTWAAMARASLSDRPAVPAHESALFGDDRRAMRRRTAATLVFLSMLAALPQAVAHARVLVGMGDQKPAMFTDARFRWLGVKQARIVVSWDVQRVGYERYWARAWLLRAQAAGVEPLVAFGHVWGGPQRKLLPSVAAYRAAFLRFHRAYPWVR